ncbi:Alpha/Beta hydrolase protein [Collybia nuda]|uniref:Alpha/Beta hydrolase protein n=1 Tax=Collybia nuda TaxID=64659 RepID=A0A9P5XXC2_9AGAR|nr:Alpha/Beta hydrolase protein [Collybia nuda]
MSDSKANYPTPLELVYKCVNGIAIPMDVYVPERSTRENPAPVLLWWHGGGLLQGTRKALSPHMLTAPAVHGLCVVSVDYRLAPQTRFPGILADCKDAMDFIRSETFAKATGNRVNSSKLVLSGSSAGGWLSLLCGTGIGYEECGLERPAPVTGIAAFYPITDLLDSFWTTKQSPVSYVGRKIEHSEIAPFIDPSGPKTTASPLDGKRSMFYPYMLQEAILSSLLLDGTSIPPISFSVAQSLKSGRFTPPPTYIVHGTKDDKVPHKQATDVVAALKEINAHIIYEELEGLDHNFDKDASYGMDIMYDFILKVVKK